MTDANNYQQGRQTQGKKKPHLCDEPTCAGLANEEDASWGDGAKIQELFGVAQELHHLLDLRLHLHVIFHNTSENQGPYTLCILFFTPCQIPSQGLLVK